MLEFLVLVIEVGLSYESSEDLNFEWDKVQFYLTSLHHHEILTTY